MSSALLTLAGSGGGESQGPSFLKTTTYSGDSVNFREFNVGHPTNLVWVKKTSTTSDWVACDTNRGAGEVLYPNEPELEVTLTNTIREFTATGFKTGTSGTTNALGSNYVAYSFSTGATASSNTDGTITATVNAGVDNGFSICTYTGNGISGATYGHGLNSTPELVITKNLPNNYLWVATGADIGLNLYLKLDSNAVTSGLSQALPGSSVINLSNVFLTNASGQDYVSWCFHSVPGKSKIGTYTGTGSIPGQTITTGFRPGFVLIKAVDDNSGWFVYDSQQDTTNPRTLYLTVDSIDGQQSNAQGLNFNETSFDVRQPFGTQPLNVSGKKYLYFAIAEES